MSWSFGSYFWRVETRFMLLTSWRSTLALHRCYVNCMARLGCPDSGMCQDWDWSEPWHWIFFQVSIALLWRKLELLLDRCPVRPGHLQLHHHQRPVPSRPLQEASQRGRGIRPWAWWSWRTFAGRCKRFVSKTGKGRVQSRQDPKSKGRMLTDIGSFNNHDDVTKAFSRMKNVKHWKCVSSGDTGGWNHDDVVREYPT